MPAQRTSYVTLQKMIIEGLPRTYGPIVATMYRNGWLEGSLCAVGEMPKFSSTRMNVYSVCHGERELDYITARAKLDWERTKHGQLSFDLMRLSQWLSFEETSLLVFYKQMVEVTQAKMWKSMLRNHR